MDDYDDVQMKIKNVSTTVSNVKRRTYSTIIFLFTFVSIMFIQNLLSEMYVKYCTFNIFKYFDKNNNVFDINIFLFLPTAGGPVCKYIWFLVDNTHNVYINLFVSSFITSYSS